MLHMSSQVGPEDRDLNTLCMRTMFCLTIWLDLQLGYVRPLLLSLVFCYLFAYFLGEINLRFTHIFYGDLYIHILDPLG
jgi:hypothetical protein